MALAAGAALSRAPPLPPLCSPPTHSTLPRFAQEIPALTYTQLPVQSLEHQRQKELPASATDTALKRAMLRLLGYYSRESTLMRGGEALLAAVVEASDSPAFQAAFQVPDTFQHRHSVLCMHVWLLLQRLRTEGDDGKDIGQSMYDGFQEEVERRARATGAKVSAQFMAPWRFFASHFWGRGGGEGEARGKVPGVLPWQ